MLAFKTHPLYMIFFINSLISFFTVVCAYPHWNLNETYIPAESYTNWPTTIVIIPGSPNQQKNTSSKENNSTKYTSTEDNITLGDYMDVHINADEKPSRSQSSILPLLVAAAAVAIFGKCLWKSREKFFASRPKSMGIMDDGEEIMDISRL